MEISAWKEEDIWEKKGETLQSGKRNVSRVQTFFEAPVK